MTVFMSNDRGREGETHSHTIRPVDSEVGKDLGVRLDSKGRQKPNHSCVDQLTALTRTNQLKVLDPVRFLKTSSRLTPRTPGV